MGIGSAIGGVMGKLGKAIGPELAAQAEGAAVQQAGAQIGSAVVNSPHALRQRLSSLEQMAVNPAGWGNTPFDSWFPAFAHTINVSIAGGPEANIHDIWNLAVATAFGRFRQRIATFAGVNVRCVWDITDKAVAIRIDYGSNGLIPALLAAHNIRGESVTEIIQKGPTAETVGGSWAGFLQTVPQLLERSGGFLDVIGGRKVPGQTGQIENPTSPGNTTRTGVIQSEKINKPPVLPDDGRLITTARIDDPNVQPPRPSDYTNYVAIISAALTVPCYLPCKPPEGFQVEEPKGKRFYEAGKEPKGLNRKELIVDAEEWAEEGLPIPTGLDGYVPPTEEAPVVPDECGVAAELRANIDANPEEDEE